MLGAAIVATHKLLDSCLIMTDSQPGKINSKFSSSARKPKMVTNRRTYYTYILSNQNRRIYIGMTNDLDRRIHEHKTSTKGFAASYRMTKLVYFETFKSPHAALERERIMKKWRREKKIQLIESQNPMWDELVLESEHEISRPKDSK
jgi:putative endonuclease